MTDRPLITMENYAAMHKAAYFIVQSYQRRGFNARWTRDHLQQDMTKARRAGLWSADQYTLAAEIYRDCIHRLFGELLTFDVAVE